LGELTGVRPEEPRSLLCGVVMHFAYSAMFHSTARLSDFALCCGVLVLSLLVLLMLGDLGLYPLQCAWDFECESLIHERHALAFQSLIHFKSASKHMPLACQLYAQAVGLITTVFHVLRALLRGVTRDRSRP